MASLIWWFLGHHEWKTGQIINCLPVKALIEWEHLNFYGQDFEVIYDGKNTKTCFVEIYISVSLCPFWVFLDTWTQHWFRSWQNIYWTVLVDWLDYLPYCIVCYFIIIRFYVLFKSAKIHIVFKTNTIRLTWYL